MATTWYAQNSSVNIDSANEWNDVANGSGNWLTWASLAADDTLDTNGKAAITINVDFTCALLTGSGQCLVASTRTITTTVQGGTGQIINIGAGNLTVIGDVYTSGFFSAIILSNAASILSVQGDVTGSDDTATSYGINNTTATAVGGGSIAVDGNVTGGAAGHGIYGGATAPITVTGGGTVSGSAAAMGIFLAANAALNITADVTGGSGSGKYGIGINSRTGGLTVTGAVTGGSAATAYGIQQTSATAMTITGNVTGGTGNATGYGIFCSGAAAVGITGTVTGGGTNGANGVQCTNATSVLTVNGSIVDTASAQAVYARKLIWNPTATQKMTAQAPGSTTKDYYYDLPIAGNVTEDDTVAGVTGTYHEATEAEVQSGVTFGASQALTGTYVGGGGGSGRPEIRGGNL